MNSEAIVERIVAGELSIESEEARALFEREPELRETCRELLALTAELDDVSADLAAARVEVVPRSIEDSVAHLVAAQRPSRSRWFAVAAAVLLLLGVGGYLLTTGGGTSAPEAPGDFVLSESGVRLGPKGTMRRGKLEFQPPGGTQIAEFRVLVFARPGQNMDPLLESDWRETRWTVTAEQVQAFPKAVAWQLEVRRLDGVVRAVARAELAFVD